MCLEDKIQWALWIQTLSDYPAAKISHFVTFKLSMIS